MPDVAWPTNTAWKWCNDVPELYCDMRETFLSRVGFPEVAAVRSTLSQHMHVSDEALGDLTELDTFLLFLGRNGCFMQPLKSATQCATDNDYFVMLISLLLTIGRRSALPGRLYDCLLPEHGAADRNMSGRMCFERIKSQAGAVQVWEDLLLQWNTQSINLFSLRSASHAASIDADKIKHCSSKVHEYGLRPTRHAACRRAIALSPSGALIFGARAVDVSLCSGALQQDTRSGWQ